MSLVRTPQQEHVPLLVFLREAQRGLQVLLCFSNLTAAKGSQLLRPLLNLPQRQPAQPGNAGMPRRIKASRHEFVCPAG